MPRRSRRRGLHRRKHQHSGAAPLPPLDANRPSLPLRVEHEHERRGAWAYLAAWDVHQARLFGRCERQIGIAASDRLVAR
jgi:hypothetical protein